MSPSPAPLRSSSSSGRLVKVKCSFCGNTFYAAPRDAVCRKCNRPANRPLSPALRAAAFFVPPFGFAYSAWLRSHSPLAASQGMVASCAGTVFYAALYAAKTLF